MARFYTEQEIAGLLAERKALPADYVRRLWTFASKRGHKESHLDIAGVNGSQFEVILRQSTVNPLDFSVILAYHPPKSTQTFRLRRYNGKSHEHTNKIEAESFYDFHIHQATERYQRSGFREDAYAKPSGRYQGIREAVDCLILDCGFELPMSDQMELFNPGDES